MRARAVGHRPFAALVAALVAALPAVTAAGQTRGARFDPADHGFRFANTFKNDALPALNLRTSGLCGGMSYAALDWFAAGRAIPRQDYRPANGTPLHRYIYARQVTSIVDNAGRWLELFADVRGVRRTEFFERGLDGRDGGELAALRSALARGAPVPLGLKAVERTGGHQVLALGCEMGRYRGDLGNERGDLRVLLYDPNFPGRVMTMVPVPEQRLYRYAERPQVEWTAWFVDQKYAPAPPPELDDPDWPADGKVHELVLECTVGGDDLRGGGENLDVAVLLADGGSQAFANVNVGARWLANYREHARIVRAEPVRAAAIRGVELRAAFSDAADGCAVDLQRLRVRALGNGIDEQLGEAAALHLTPAAPRSTVACRPPRRR